jgi:DNA-binding response OmpR family regulator
VPTLQFNVFFVPGVGDREKALAAGCDAYDTKPIKMRRLLGKIKNLMEK